MTNGRTDPYLDYRFKVELDGLIVAGFTEVSGLEREIETESYDEGGVNHYTHQFPKRVTHSNLQLKRGVTDSTELWNWFQQTVYGPVVRKNVRVVLLGRTGQEVHGWEFRGAYPVRWAGPDLGADGSAVAVETLELTHKGISRMEGLSPG